MRTKKTTIMRVGKARLPMHDFPVRNSTSLAAVLEELKERPDVLGREQIDPAAIEIGLKIKRIRETQKMSQALLADRTGLKQSAISLIESGKGRDGPSYRTLREIMRVLGVDIELVPHVGPIPAEPVRTSGMVRLEDDGGALKLVDETRSADACAPLLKALLTPEVLADTRRAIIEILSGKTDQSSATEGSPCGYWSAAAHSTGTLAARCALLVVALNGEGTIKRRTSESVASSDQVVVVPRRARVDITNDGSEPLAFMTMPVTAEVAQQLDAGVHA